LYHWQSLVSQIKFKVNQYDSWADEHQGDYGYLVGDRFVKWHLKGTAIDKVDDWLAGWAPHPKHKLFDVQVATYRDLLGLQDDFLVFSKKGFIPKIKELFSKVGRERFMEVVRGNIQGLHVPHIPFVMARVSVGNKIAGVLQPLGQGRYCRLVQNITGPMVTIYALVKAYQRHDSVFGTIDEIANKRELTYLGKDIGMALLPLGEKGQELAGGIVGSLLSAEGSHYLRKIKHKYPAQTPYCGHVYRL
jgi:hypothetical protein